MRLVYRLMGWSLIALVCATIAVADPVPVQWDTIATHPDLYDNPSAVDGEAVGLVVSNHGEMGHCGLGGANMDFVASGYECGTRPEDAIYLYSGSPFVIQADDASGTNARVTCSYGQLDDSKVYSWTPVDDLGSMRSGTGANNWEGGVIEYDSLFSGRFVDRNGALAMDRVFYTKHGPYYNMNGLVLVRTKLYSYDGLSHDHLSVGSLIDWNIPSDPADANISQEYYGYVHAAGTDATSSSCQSHTGRFGIEWPTNYYLHSDANNKCVDQPEPYGTVALHRSFAEETGLTRGGRPLDPPEPDAEAWWEDIATYAGSSPNPTPEDQAIWQTYLYDFTLDSEDTLYVWTVIATVRDGNAYKLWNRYESGRTLHFFVSCASCTCAGRVGDANGIGGDEPTIGDISVMIDAKFITGTCDGILDCFDEADVNQTGPPSAATCGDVTVGDMSILIDYLFIGGPENVVLPDCF